ncbi:SCO7613 C-terminal domain-containing membrane protein [Kribbella sp. NPDC051586]|uniref:SCO7613 C-terminal domain-containing membrane protein n=1 Tax=Kribbella sp. NPDC051586 TaxID=3364118 RepID=UPI003792C367
MSPQATLLTLGVLLLLAAGVTFLAVTWDSLPVPAQAGIIATLAALALVCSVPASRRTLTGTAEALAILGTGLLTVDLYGARALGLTPPIGAATYSAIVFATLAVLTLLMTRLAPKVTTYGVITVIAAQLPLPLTLLNRTSLPVILATLLAQVVATLALTTKGTPIVRRTGAVTAAVVFCTILITGLTYTLLGLLTHTDLHKTVATTAVVCLTAVTGLAILRKRPLPASFPAGAGEAICAASGAFTLATCLPQLPGPSRWLTTALAATLALTALLLTRSPARRGAFVLHITTITLAAVDVVLCAAFNDIRQLGYIAAILAVLSVLAAIRNVVSPIAAAPAASLSAQLAIILFAVDGYITLWPVTITLALVGAIGTSIACRHIARPLERVLIPTTICATALAEITATLVSPTTATAVVLTITAAPLVAYGINPRRRPALLLAALFLIIANTAFMLGADTTTLEWYTVPPALVLLAAGFLAYRNQSTWISLAPCLLIGLLPSTLVPADNWLRTTLVVAAALAIVLIATRHSLQAPFLIGAAVLAKTAIWQFLDLAPQIPRWITLATAGLLLLLVGATYERRLTQAKQATRWIASLR